MQATGPPALSTPPSATGKKTYLALLPPSQIIDICLTFEPYAPPHVKSLVWPVDINAAIASLQPPQQPGPSKQQQQQPDDVPQSKKASSSNEKPVMSSLLDVPQPTLATTTPQPPFAGYHPIQAAYPHAPYYSHQLPHGYPSYPSFTQMAHPHSNTPPCNVPNTPPDDLPSYEDMIVEALKDFADPEGVAPKALFSWMASHYPLQTNFRPSASQALQKAFKRGRLEKGTNGRYRLNPSWEGGSTSRRTTRRPQTQSLTMISPPTPQHGSTPTAASPFTHTPLNRVPHPPRGSTPAHQPYPYYPYPYPPPPPGYPGYPPYPPPPSGWPADEDITEGSDAWKAAQSILKAINFDGQTVGATTDTTATSAGKSVDAVTTVTATPIAGPSTVSQLAHQPSQVAASGGDGRVDLQVHLALLAAQLMGIAQAKEAGQEHSTKVVVDTGLSGEDNDMDEEEDLVVGGTAATTK